MILTLMGLGRCTDLPKRPFQHRSESPNANTHSAEAPGILSAAAISSVDFLRSAGVWSGGMRIV